ncbi:hypothetical protein [Spirosoma pollinicola]|uniref:3-keto-disaccharide hydrolase domain-containing protein n=1 Tax=Spirosoma pollinicola TaxID=2057025 RepID=A0A2K8YSM8_9BACT|nr:hypothetical protein [Spirosoma pollinicola]AUD00588.1 hypothetical protein CWM47_01390 [Spirosoma pollinicola]
MRLFLTTALVVITLVNSVAQSTGRRPKMAIFSASSEWQKVTLKPTSALAVSPSGRPSTAVEKPASSPVGQAAPVTVTNPTEVMAPARTAPYPTVNSDYHPAFTGDFATNRNGWKAGIKGDYYFQIGLGRYSIRKRNTNTTQVALSTVELPADINLNRAEVFTIKVDVLADSGQVPSGGIVFGIKDSLNYNAFTLNAKGEVSIIRVANGSTFGDYMPGDFFSPGVSVEKNRDRLSIQRRGDELHFYVNAVEIRSSPYPFKMFAGNGIGLMASGYWTSFQKLTVTLGL